MKSTRSTLVTPWDPTPPNFYTGGNTFCSGQPNLAHHHRRLFSSKQQALTHTPGETLSAADSGLGPYCSISWTTLGGLQATCGQHLALVCSVPLSLVALDSTLVPNMNLVNTVHHILVTLWPTHPTCVLPQAISAAEPCRQPADSGSSLGALSLFLSCLRSGTGGSQIQFVSWPPAHAPRSIKGNNQWWMAL